MSGVMSPVSTFDHYLMLVSFWSSFDLFQGQGIPFGWLDDHEKLRLHFGLVLLVPGITF